MDFLHENSTIYTDLLETYKPYYNPNIDDFYIQLVNTDNEVHIDKILLNLFVKKYKPGKYNSSEYTNIYFILSKVINKYVYILHIYNNKYIIHKIQYLDLSIEYYIEVPFNKLEQINGISNNCPDKYILCESNNTCVESIIECYYNNIFENSIFSRNQTKYTRFIFNQINQFILTLYIENLNNIRKNINTKSDNSDNYQKIKIIINEQLNKNIKIFNNAFIHIETKYALRKITLKDLLKLYKSKKTSNIDIKQLKFMVKQYIRGLIHISKKKIIDTILLKMLKIFNKFIKKYKSKVGCFIGSYNNILVRSEFKNLQEIYNKLYILIQKNILDYGNLDIFKKILKDIINNNDIIIKYFKENGYEFVKESTESFQLNLIISVIIDFLSIKFNIKFNNFYINDILKHISVVKKIISFENMYNALVQNADKYNNNDVFKLENLKNQFHKETLIVLYTIILDEFDISYEKNDTKYEDLKTIVINKILFLIYEIIYLELLTNHDKIDNINILYLF